jgi:hypothetical protein
MKKRSGEHLEGLKVLKERLDGTVPTLPPVLFQTRTPVWNWEAPFWN